MELTGEPPNENGNLKTVLIASSKSDDERNADERRKQDFGNCMFSLTNSTLSLKSIHFSLIDNSEEGRQQTNEARTTKLAIVSSSMLTISESKIELSSWTSPILISPSTLEESGTSSSVVVQNSWMWSDIGEMRGLVETSAFADLGASVSVSIVGCSFDSTRIMEIDGIGLSLTLTPRKRNEENGRISSSLISCSFVNVSSIDSSCQPRLPHLNQKMLGCVVSLTSSHLSGSTIRDVNNGGSVLCSNSSFSSLLPSPNADPPQGTVTLPDESTEAYVETKVYYFDITDGDSDETTSIIFSHCRFSGDNYPSARPLTFYMYRGAMSVQSCTFSGIASSSEEAGAVYVLYPGQFNRVCFTANSSNFTSCSASQNGGAMFVSVLDATLINLCRFEHCSTTGESSTGGALRLGGLLWNGQVQYQFQLVDCVIADCKAVTRGGGVHMMKHPHLIRADDRVAVIFIHFDKPVEGSYDFVVEEEGKDVTITVELNESAKTGKSSEMIVVGDERLLTHNTTYTIKSIVPTPGTDSSVVFMNDVITFHIPTSSYVRPEEPEPEDPKKSQLPQEMKTLLSWLIPLVVCLLVALIVVIIIVLLRRRPKKNASPAQKEMEAQEQVEFEEKVEVVADAETKNVLHTDGRSHAAFNSSNAEPTNLNPSSHEVMSICETKRDLVEVMACSGGFEVSLAGASTTLYSVLHNEKRDIPKRALGIQLVNGLKAVLANRQTSDVLTRLSSHWILIDTAGNVQLKLKMTSEEAEQEAAQTQTQNPQTLPKLEGNENEQTDKSGMDGLRLRAPEVVASKGGQVDGHKAAVFSLGLVLWEIETGQVPFGELDAVNAQRQSATGIGPKMESLQNEEFIALILQCIRIEL
ncbi:hypothetical protein BLNAU_14724 [Blattamonas nauphoetae]|uniref:Protein kinase domain-containing protein n=1 Tax=Blattamonas nauphoetae TaxID=2049346 RepID=A0ABQ9XG68_9EUKA|nr:hypothetical protein BLNAU_14724 [Blattamonas nauphoetae]